MEKLVPILAHLEACRAGLFAVTDPVPASLWRSSPRLDAWSTAEVIAHLIVVEKAITASADKLVRHPPRYEPVWKRLHIPVRATEFRGIRRKSPLPLDRTLLADKEVMLATLRQVRATTLAFLNDLPPHDLGIYRWPHPFLGSLNFYDWFRVIGYHELRHSKQIRIATKLGNFFPRRDKNSSELPTVLTSEIPINPARTT